MVEKYFNSNGLFWQTIIKIEDGEILIFKNNESHPFYYFNESEWDMRLQEHMADKNWFTQEMAYFISQNIEP